MSDELGRTRSEILLGFKLGISRVRGVRGLSISCPAVQLREAVVMRYMNHGGRVGAD